MDRDLTGSDPSRHTATRPAHDVGVASARGSEVRTLNQDEVDRVFAELRRKAQRAAPDHQG